MGSGASGRGPTPPSLREVSAVQAATRLSEHGPAASAVPPSFLTSLPAADDPCAYGDDAVAEVRGSGNDYQLHLDVKQALGLSPAYPASLSTTPASTAREASAGKSRSDRPGLRLGPKRRPASAPPARTGQRAEKTLGAEAAQPPSTPGLLPAAGPAGAGLRRSQSLTSSNPSSQAYLKEHALMQEAKAKARKAGADHAGSASLYRHLCHMSEANALAEDLSLQTRFRPHRKEGSKKDEVVCRIYEDGALTTEVPLPFFERRFKTLQGRWNQLVVTKADKKNGAAAKRNKPRSEARPTSASQVVVAPSTSAATGEGGPESYAPPGVRPPTILSEKEQDSLQRQIKRVTLETLALADRMWQQLEGLEKHPKPLNPFVVH